MDKIQRRAYRYFLEFHVVVDVNISSFTFQSWSWSYCRRACEIATTLLGFHRFWFWYWSRNLLLLRNPEPRNTAVAISLAMRFSHPVLALQTKRSKKRILKLIVWLHKISLALLDKSNIFNCSRIAILLTCIVFLWTIYSAFLMRL